MIGAKHLTRTKERSHVIKQRSPDEIRVWQVATPPSCLWPDCTTEAESSWLLLFNLLEACYVVENLNGLWKFADPKEGLLLLLVSMLEEDNFGVADLETTGLLPWLFLDGGDLLPPKKGCSKFLSLVNFYRTREKDQGLDKWKDTSSKVLNINQRLWFGPQHQCFLNVRNCNWDHMCRIYPQY